MARTNRRTPNNRPHRNRPHRNRLRIERLEARTLLAGDVGLGEIELFAEPLINEFAPSDVAAQVDTSFSEAVFGPIEPESLSQESLAPQAADETELVDAEVLISDFIAQPQITDVLANDELLRDTSELEELFNQDRLLDDSQLLDRQTVQPALLAFDQEVSLQDEAEPSQQADELKSFGDDQQANLSLGAAG